MVYKEHPERVARIGQELGVQYVLEGSVRREADKVRVSAQLIETKDNTHVWAREYDRDLTDLLTLQGEIARKIADEIQLTLDDQPKAQTISPSPSMVNYEAYDLYLKGRYFWNKRTPQAFEQAIEYFQQSIAKNPNYARAYAGLADSYVLMSAYTLAPQTEYMPKARAAALKALELDPELAEGHASLALITENYDWDWQMAEKEFRRAIQLDSNYATAHHWYAEYLANQGRFDEAFAESERARQLDPLSLIIVTDHAVILYFSRQYDRAIEQFRMVMEMEPNFPRADMVNYAYVQSGRYTDAIEGAKRAQRMDGTSSPWTWGILAYVYGRSGKPEQGRHALDMLEQFYRRRELDPAAMILAHIGMGDKEDALALLQKAYLEHSNLMTTLKVDPTFDPLRGDPRFQEIVRKMGLAQ
jgi:tetratricopeptide (TPR) repeat protein